MGSVRRAAPFLAALACVLVAAPAALSWRAPTAAERKAIVAGLPSFYHQDCIRYRIRVSKVNRRFAAVFFRFVAPSRRGCSPFDGQVLMKRLTAAEWRKVGEGSEWPCREPGVAKSVIRDLFGGCGP